MAGRASDRLGIGLKAPRPGRTFAVRMAVPKDIRTIVESLPADDARRAAFVNTRGDVKWNLVETTARRDPKEAERQAAAIRADWLRKIAELRGPSRNDELSAALARIETWRAEVVAGAQGLHIESALMDFADSGRLPRTAPGVAHGGSVWAQRFFDGNPEASRDPTTPNDTFMLLDRLQVASHGGEAWRDIPDFDDALGDAVAFGRREEAERPGGTTGAVAGDPTRPAKAGKRSTIPSEVRAALRPAFARAWADVVRAQEAERRHAALIMALVEGAEVTVPRRPDAYQPRPGDRTVGELLDAYLADYARKHDSTKDTVAPTRALREFLGAKTPVRAVRRDDARRFADFVETLPANAGKLYAGLPLAEAAERAKSDGKPVISSVTANRYMTFASMIWNWGRREGEGWADDNPFEGQARPKKASVKREGFTNDELVALFGRLKPFKTEGQALFWVPALGLNGARISELLQLRPGDVKKDGETLYLDLSPFDETGRRDDAKRVKTDGSERLAPIHPLAIDAGFLELVERRRREGAERLFPEIKPRAQPGGKLDWGHYYSRRINAILDKAVSDAPRLVGGHGFRHTLRERALEHDVPEEVVDAIGGWSQRSIGRRYGRKRIKLLADNLAKFDFGPLRL